MMLAREGSYLRRLGGLLAARDRELLQVASCSLAGTALGVATPWLTRLVVDQALPNRAPQWLTVVALGALLVALQRAAFGWLEQRALLSLHGQLEAAVCCGLFEHLLRIPYPALAREHVGGWLETLYSGRQVQGLLTHGLLAPLLHAAMALAYGAALARESMGLALALAGATGLIMGVAVALAARVGAVEQAVIASAAAQQATLHELLRGMPTLHSAGARHYGSERWLERSLIERSACAQQARLRALARSLTAGARELIGLGCLLYAGALCLDGAFSLGALLAILLLAERFVSASLGLADVLTPIASARPRAQRVDGLLALPDVTDQRASWSPPRARYAIELEDVWFRYAPDRPWVLEGYTLRVPVGGELRLEAPSGAGKTTILRLIAGLYAPERGTVRVLGQPPQQTSRAIAYLPQAAHLFEGSIVDNLRLLSDASDEAIANAAAESGLDALLATLPMGPETLLTAGANNFSGGQRQLIAWTAAMASERPVLLLDEALSQLDSISKKHLLAMRTRRARTTLFVEHDA